MSFYCEVSGIRATKGSITFPFYGCWVADLTLATDDEITGRVLMSLAGVTYAGTVYRGAAFAGLREVRIVGGGNGWRTVIPAKYYNSPTGVPASMILNDAAKEVGESVKLQSDSSVGTSFVREQAPAQNLLRQLSGGLWWMKSDGVTQLGVPRDSTKLNSQFTIIQYYGGEGLFVVSSDSAEDWVPGRKFSSPLVSGEQTISSVTHRLTEEGTARLFVLVQ